MTDELPETLIGLFVQQLNAKLADQYRMQRAENRELHTDIERLLVFYNLLRDAVSWFDAHNIDHLPQWVVSARRALEHKP